MSGQLHFISARETRALCRSRSKYVRTSIIIKTQEKYERNKELNETTVMA